MMLKLYIYGYLNRMPSSRHLERECPRNIEVIWLTDHLAPDFKTIADFRRDNSAAIREVCRAVPQTPTTECSERRISRAAGRFLSVVGEIASDEGYAINARKTRIVPRSGRQLVTGVVVNAHNNIARPEYDRLKAILHNCSRNGPAAENREGHSDFRAHLDGKVTWAENVNPRRGWKLRALFQRIEWQAEGAGS